MIEEKKSVDEQRVKPTVIRRRAKVEEPAKAPEPTTAKPAATPAGGPSLRATDLKPAVGAKPTPAVASELPPLTGSAKEEADKAAPKGPKKKKSKAELELEDIQRAGGLKKFATQELTVAEWEPAVERVFQPTTELGRRKKPMRREFKKTAVTETKVSKKVVRIQKGITISELSRQISVKNSDIIKKLMGLGMMTTANQTIDVDTATLLASDYGYEVVHTAFNEEEVLQTGKKAVAPVGGETRAPVVTVMGHVDHGKTSLLDAIRKTNVTEGEAGGITQHIGAYEVHLPTGSITFIDTPGHAAFTKMRARGAQVTDVVILVVAADDGIMPQTIEAIAHAKSAGVPIIVAINKIDKPGADLEKVKRGLTEHGLVPEEWGGDVICAPVSAKQKQGIEHLLEMILLVGQMKELKAPHDGPARGIVIESRLDKGRGPVATVLIKSGTLKAGQYAVAGLSYGRVRGMQSAEGKILTEVHPSQPAELIGLENVPEAGDEIFVVESERDARQIYDSRIQKKREESFGATSKLSLEALQEKIAKGETHELPLVIKADVAGSREALVEALQGLTAKEATVKIIHSGTGAITENDCLLAQATHAVVIGFQVTAEAKARQFAQNAGIDLRIHKIIYEVLDDVKKAMLGLLKPKLVEKFMGRGTVKQVFKISKLGAIAGMGVTEGTIHRGHTVRLTRDGKIITQGKIASLKRFKDDAREVSSGMECGLGIENYNDLKEGDIIEAFVIEEVREE